jgi:hypothetical protein
MNYALNHHTLPLEGILGLGVIMLVLSQGFDH